MAQNTGQFQFKAFLVNQLNYVQGKDPVIIEARRFMAQVIDGPGAFGLVCSRIEEYLTALQGKTYTLFWKDEDGDFIKVSTDQEVTHAITVMHSSAGLVKLYAQMASAVPTTEHPTVTCDGCNARPVRGFRYKCLQCPDYDLCGVCESRGVHPEHNMIRFSGPVFPDGLMGNILKRRLRRHMRESFGCEKQDEEVTSSNSEDEGACHFEKRGRHHKDKGEGYRKGHRRHNKDRGQCHGDWGLPLPHPELGCRRRRDVFRDVATSTRNAAHAAACATANIATDPNTIAYLRNVGQNFYKLLDPLGASAQTDTNTRATASQAGQPAAPATDSAPASQPQQPDVDMMQPTSAADTPTAPAAPGPNANALQDLINVAVQSAPGLLNAVQQITESLAQQHVDSSGDGWTVLNADDREQSPRRMDVAPQAPQQDMSPASADAARLYPDLAPGTTASPTPSAPSSLPTGPHPNALVERGVHTLTAMGFSNEGNLLTRVLEIHNGDIGKALDILQVIRK